MTEETPLDLNQTPQADSSEPHIVNVQSIRQEKSGEKIYKEVNWYDRLVYWVVGGVIIGLIFAAASLVVEQFLFLAPVFPVAFSVAWLIRRVLVSSKFSDMNDPEKL